MKKTVLFFMSMAAVLVAASCNKMTSSDSPVEGKKMSVFVEIKGDMAGGLTKAVGNTAANEAKVNNLQVFVFNNGNLEDYASVDESLTAVLNATSGTRELWAVVNAPSLADVRTLTELKAQASLLGSNGLDNFVMVGSTTHELGGDADSTHPISITVRRIVSRVSLLGVTSDFKLSLSGASFDVTKIYLINVVGNQLLSIGGESAYVANPTLWLNQLGYTSTDPNALLYDVVTGVTVNNTTPFEERHDFYPYPNALGQGRSDQTADSPKAGGTNVYTSPFSARQTMLVIEGVFHENAEDSEGVVGYYPIDLPALERNKLYLIESVKLTRRPSAYPYGPVETGESYVTISVHDWETGLSLGTIEC